MQSASPPPSVTRDAAAARRPPSSAPRPRCRTGTSSSRSPPWPGRPGYSRRSKNSRVLHRGAEPSERRPRAGGGGSGAPDEVPLRLDESRRLPLEQLARPAQSCAQAPAARRVELFDAAARATRRVGSRVRRPHRASSASVTARARAVNPAPPAGAGRRIASRAAWTSTSRQEHELVRRTVREFARAARRAGRRGARPREPLPVRARGGAGRARAHGHADPGGVRRRRRPTRVSYALAIEELARVDSSVAITVAAHHSLGTLADPALRQRGAEARVAARPRVAAGSSRRSG